MTRAEFEIVHTPDEMRRKLLEMDITTARRVTVMEGVSGYEDTVVNFKDAQQNLRGVKFSSVVIPAGTAHQVITELMVPQRKRQGRLLGRLTTHYTKR